MVSIILISTSIKNEEKNLYDRLRDDPESFSDGDLRVLIETHEHGRGRNYSITAQAFLILDSRTTPPLRTK